MSINKAVASSNHLSIYTFRLPPPPLPTYPALKLSKTIPNKIAAGMSRGTEEITFLAIVGAEVEGKKRNIHGRMPEKVFKK